MRKRVRKSNQDYAVLEARQVLSANFFVDLTDGVLAVHGTQAADTVRFVERGDSIVVGVSSNRGSYTVHQFDAADVDRLYFSGKDGDDIFVNKTSLESTAYGNEGNDWLLGGSGDDVLRGGNGDDNIRGFAGDDSLHGDRGNDRLVGQAGNDRLLGWFGDDVLVGGDGDDYLSGYLGNDRLFAGDGDDDLRGHEGDDFLSGGNGDDALYGWRGNDRLFAGAGDDYVSGYHGDDFLSGGAGDDVVKGHLGNDRLFGGDGDDELYGWRGDDRINGGNGNDELWGGDDNDVLFGWRGNDILHGDHGDDRLYGGDGDDVLIGYFGNDFISGGLGVDMLCGGHGDDTYANVEDHDLGYDPDQDLVGVFDNSESVLSERLQEQFEQAIEDFDAKADEVARLVQDIVDYDDSPLATDTSSSRLWFTDSNQSLSWYDTSTGEFQVVGQHGVLLTDLAVSAEGELYGISFRSLYRVDANTGEAFLVGDLGRGDMNALTFTEDGRLLAAGFAGDQVYEVDVTTGQTTSIGSAGARSAGDLAFHDGQLFLTSNEGELVAMTLNDDGQIGSVETVGATDGLAFGLASLDGELYSTVGTTLFDVDVSNNSTFSAVAVLSGQGAVEFYGLTEGFNVS